MEGIYTQVTHLMTKPEDYIRPSKKLEGAWMEQTQAVYNFLKEEEDRHGLPAPSGTLPRMHADGLDVEQVWQLVELQNKALLAAPENLEGLDNTNLCFMVAQLSSLAQHDKLSHANELLAEDEGIGGSAQESEDMDSDDKEEDEQEMDNNESGLNNNEESDEDMSENDDDEMFEKPEGFKDSGLNDVFADDSDDEEDNFDEFISKEGMESDDSEEEGNKKGHGGNANIIQKNETKQEKVNEGKKFAKSKVDTKFFNLRESEWVADHDAIGDNYSGDGGDDVDLMADMSDGSEGEEDIMYDAFFDKAPEATDGPGASGKKLSEMLGEEEDDEEEDEQDEGEDEQDDEDDEEEAKDSVNDEDTEAPEEVITQLLGAPKKESKSTFEKERERELELMEQLEEENLTEKPWYLKGEIANSQRPQNSALEEHLEYDIAVRQKPIITEDTTSQVEKIIMGRIRIKAWDDVERKVRPNVDPYEFKKKLILEQDKSKKSLAEIYEEEFLKKQKEQVEGEEEEEPKEHKEIKERMDKLFMKLDALSNYHYTPKQPVTDIKIVSNLPAITVEETTPATASDANLLAPQEILESVRGELVGDTERSATDCKRDRRIKKKHQKNKAKMQEKKLEEKVRMAGAKGGTGKLDRSSTMKVIEKAVKSGQVKLLEGNQDKAVKSSQTFFKQLQDTHTKKQKNEKPKKRKKDQFSASKLLL